MNARSAADETPDLLARLRQDTAALHTRLEDDLDLLRPPLTLAHMQAVLKRFLGFHLAWEPAIQLAFRDEPDLVVPRLRLSGLREDLFGLGVSAAEQDGVPVDTAAGDLAADLPHALGSLYVIEGSALGGQLISRALAGAEWLPAGGLRFFSPYGAATGAMWRGFRDRLTAASSPSEDPLIVAGAQATFAELHHWMQPVFRSRVSAS